MDLPYIELGQKSGSEGFSVKGSSTDLCVLDYWRWSASDLISNTQRGVLAEFIVGSALGAIKSPRTEWDSFDLETSSGIAVEVKSCAYIQAWHQKEFSKILFSVPETKAWDPRTSGYELESRRQADVYVLCLLAHQDQKTINPLCLDQWKFFVVPTTILNKELGVGKSLSLSRLRKIEYIETDYSGIGNAVNKSYKKES